MTTKATKKTKSKKKTTRKPGSSASRPIRTGRYARKIGSGDHEVLTNEGQEKRRKEYYADALKELEALRAENNARRELVEQGLGESARLTALVSAMVALDVLDARGESATAEEMKGRAALIGKINATLDAIGIGQKAKPKPKAL